MTCLPWAIQVPPFLPLWHTRKPCGLPDPLPCLKQSSRPDAVAVMLHYPSADDDEYMYNEDEDEDEEGLPPPTKKKKKLKTKKKKTVCGAVTQCVGRGIQQPLHGGSVQCPPSRDGSPCVSHV